MIPNLPQPDQADKPSEEAPQEHSEQQPSSHPSGVFWSVSTGVMVVFQDVEKSCYYFRVVFIEEISGELKLRQNLDRVSLIN